MRHGSAGKQPSQQRGLGHLSFPDHRGACAAEKCTNLRVQVRGYADAILAVPSTPQARGSTASRQDEKEEEEEEMEEGYRKV